MTQMSSGPGDGTAEVFDTHLAQWQQWQQAPWGRLRYRVVEALLDRHLADLTGSGTSLAVLDVGGGDGADSVRLGALGHRVVVADQSRAMLESAQARATAAGAEVRTVEVGLDGVAAHPDVRALLPAGADVVLSHNVLQYCDDLDAAVRQTLAVARPGALVSVIVTNPVSHVLRRVVRDLDPGAALEVLDQPTFPTITFGHAVHRISWQEGAAALERSGCRVEARYGVLCVNHLVTADERKHDPGFLADLERLELALADRDPYRDIASMWMLVGRASGAAGADGEQ